ncbi:MAG: indole-3-glycerol phosphate synthase TrpC [Blastocatellia bacterium]|nr:indole-3-glycerol phosphate synthase TrpC [Blastocatellia bacterium]
MDILTKIVEKKRQRLEEAKQLRPLKELYSISTKKQSFYQALARPGQINVIAEVKKASPSKGVICQDFRPVQIARSYELAGAAALSVLTEEDFFQGSLDILRQIRSNVSIPILRKDFIVDEYQVYESLEAGADAFLLIASLLETEQISHLVDLGQKLGLDTLIEVHTAVELEKVLNSKPKIVGVNNRNLKTFEVDIQTSVKLAATVPKDTLLVSESGINSLQDIKMLQNVGYSAFLIGEHFMKAEEPGKALSALIKA